MSTHALRWWIRLAGSALLLVSNVGSAPASAFSLISNGAYVCAGAGDCLAGVGEVDVVRSLERTRRWDAAPGRELDDGIQVLVDPDFIGLVGASTPAEGQEVVDVVLRSFAAWETPELWFDIRFEARRIPDVRGEIEVFAVDRFHPSFQGRQQGGFANTLAERRSDLELTNGQVVDGSAIHYASILLQYEILGQLSNILRAGGLIDEENPWAVIEHTLMHEIGHAIGLGHPNLNPFGNFDSDSDPRTVVPVDGADPFAGLGISTNTDPMAMMLGGFPAPEYQDWFVLTELQPDDISGRDVLYPTVPEPSTGLLVVVGAAALARRRLPHAVANRSPSCRQRGIGRGGDREGSALSPSPAAGMRPAARRSTS